MTHGRVYIHEYEYKVVVGFICMYECMYVCMCIKVVSRKNIKTINSLF